MFLLQKRPINNRKRLDIVNKDKRKMQLVRSQRCKGKKENIGRQGHKVKTHRIKVDI